MANNPKQPQQPRLVEQPGIYLPREEWKADFPSADELDKMSKVHPKMVEFHFKSARREQEMRAEVLRKKVKMLEEHAEREYNLERQAMRYAFAVTCLALTGALALEISGSHVTGSIVSCFAVASMAGVFFKRKEKRVLSGSMAMTA
jgi:uncharacterized membrane protein